MCDNELPHTGQWAAVSCLELPEIRRNEEKGGDAVSSHELQDNGRIGGRGETAGS